MTEAQGFFLEYIPNRRERFWRRLFPAYLPLLPELPDGYVDAVITQTTTHFSFRDRLRLLISGRLQTRIVTATELDIGKTKTVSADIVVHSPYERSND